MPAELPKVEDNTLRKKKSLLLNNGKDNKYTHSLRRDLLVSNFDKTMTVEKTRHDPIKDISTTQSAPLISTLTQQVVLPKMEHHDNDMGLSPPKTYVLTTSPSAPTLNNIGSQSSSHALLIEKGKKLSLVKSEGGTHRIQPKKSQSKLKSNSHHHTTTSPAEVFHRNLVDAVSCVEDSDENEQYVYPYSGNESSTTATTHDIHRPLSVRSTPPHSAFDLKRKSTNKVGDWFRYALAKKEQVASVDEEEEDWSGGEYTRRPKLRNTVKEHKPHQNSTASSILSRWHQRLERSLSSSKSNRVYPPMQQKTSSQTPYYMNNGFINGYTSDEEDAPLLSRRHQKRMPRINKSQTCQHILRNCLLMTFLVLTAFFLIVLYKAQPLNELQVDVDRILATDKELIFDLKVQAQNWNWWTIHVEDADISIFAFSQIVPTNILMDHSNTSSPPITQGVDPAEYLGYLIHFDEPLSIPSSRFNNPPLQTITQVRIRSPGTAGTDTSGNERWSRMIRYPYGLVVRGVLKYKPAPFKMGIYPQSAAICNITRVDPTKA